MVDELVHLAEVHPHETFVRAVRQWERIADVDGAHDDAEHAHRGRRARIGAVGDTVYLDARVGTAQGATMVEVFEQFARAEFAAEWDDLRRRLGDEACPGRLARTEAQRRADALAAIFEAAATSLSDARRSEPVVNILIDQAVYEAQLAAMVGDDEARPDPADLGHQRCRTTSGVPVDPADAVAASVVGWVRRVVVDGDGLIINLGRRSRVFTGSARVAAILQAAIDDAGRCSWPGCGHHRIQIDHSLEWTSHGPTDLRNGGPLCGRHNRWKSRGYRTWRDPAGIWHTYRPDGTEIVAA